MPSPQPDDPMGELEKLRAALNEHGAFSDAVTEIAHRAIALAARLLEERRWRKGEPPQSGWYLVSVDAGIHPNYERYCVWQAFWNSARREWEWFIEVWPSRILAWQPLPPPWKEE